MCVCLRGILVAPAAASAPSWQGNRASCKEQCVIMVMFTCATWSSMANRLPARPPAIKLAGCGGGERNAGEKMGNWTVAV